MMAHPPRSHHLRRNAALVVTAALLALVGWTSITSGTVPVGVGLRRRHSLAWQYVDPPPNDLENWDQAYLAPWHEQPDVKLPTYDVEVNHQPHNGSYTAAIVWVTSDSRLRFTLASMESVARHMPMNQPYTFILLHEGEITLPTQKEVISRWEDRIRLVTSKGEWQLADKMQMMLDHIEFAEVDLQIPQSLARKLHFEKSYGDIVNDDRWQGYHSMCRFFSVNVFWHPRLRSYDYLMRLDSDSLIMTPMPEDPFRKLQKAGGRYAYRSETRDMDHVVVGMWELADDYGYKHDGNGPGQVPGLRQRIDDSRLVKSITEDHIYGIGSYETNFEIMHLPSFRRGDVAAFLAHLRQREDVFYKWRWGDSPLRYVTVHMFFNESDIMKCNDFTYWHQRIFPQGE